MATCARDGVWRATPASTPSRSTQAGAQHRERAEPVVFFPSSPLISATAMLSSFPSSPVPPPSTTVDAASVASAPSSSHRLRSCLLAIVQPLPSSASTGFPPPPTSPRSLSLSTVPAIHRRDPPSLPPSPFPPPSTIELLSPSSLSVAVIPTSPPSTPASINLSTDFSLPLASDYYLDHRRRLPSLFLSLRLHRLHPDTTSPASLSPSTVPAIHRRSPPPPPSSSPPCCRAPLPSSPSSTTVAEHRHKPPLPASPPSPLLPLHLAVAAFLRPSSLPSPAHHLLPALPLPTTVATSLPSIVVVLRWCQPPPLASPPSSQTSR